MSQKALYLRYLIPLQLLLLVVIPGAVQSSRSFVTPSNRATWVHIAAEYATSVLLIDIVDAVAYPDSASPRVFTSYSGTVVECYKGRENPGSDYEFYAYGGVTADRSYGIAGSVRPRAGGRYLTFLKNCDDTGLSVLFLDQLLARVEGDSVRGRWPLGAVDWSSFRDTVRTTCAPFSVAWQDSTADLVLRASIGPIELLQSNEHYYSSHGTVGVMVDSVYTQRGGPSVGPGTNITITIPESTNPHLGASGLPPVVTSGTEAFIFLRWIDGHWEFNGSYTSVWWIDSDMARSFVHDKHCGPEPVLREENPIVQIRNIIAQP